MIAKRRQQSPATNLQRFLKGADYPATKDDLMDLANENGAPDEIMEILDLFPEEVDFEGVTDVQECFAAYAQEGQGQGSKQRKQPSSSQRQTDDADIEEARKKYEARKRQRAQEQSEDDAEWDHRLKGHETPAIADARRMAHGYDGRGRVTNEEEDHRLRGNETPALADARAMRHGYDGRGRVRKFGPGNVDETISDDEQRYEQRQQQGEPEPDPETGSHSRRRKDDNGRITSGTRQTWQERYGRTAQSQQDDGEGGNQQYSGRRTWRQMNGR